MTSDLLNKLLAAGSRIARLSREFCEREGTPAGFGYEGWWCGVKQGVGGSEPILKRIDPG